jgi:hypothetical protein
MEPRRFIMEALSDGFGRSLAVEATDAFEPRLFLAEIFEPMEALALTDPLGFGAATGDTFFAMARFAWASNPPSRP